MGRWVEGVLQYLLTKSPGVLIYRLLYELCCKSGYVGLCQHAYHITHAKKSKLLILLIVQLTYLVFKEKIPHLLRNYGRNPENPGYKCDLLNFPQDF